MEEYNKHTPEELKELGFSNSFSYTPSATKWQLDQFESLKRDAELNGQQVIVTDQNGVVALWIRAIPDAPAQ